MLRAVMEKGDNMKEQTGNVSKEMETLRKNWKLMLEVKITVKIWRMQGLSRDWSQPS